MNLQGGFPKLVVLFCGVAIIRTIVSRVYIGVPLFLGETTTVRLRVHRVYRLGTRLQDSGSWFGDTEGEANGNHMENEIETGVRTLNPKPFRV